MKVFLDDVRVPFDCVDYMYYRIRNEAPIYFENWEVVRNYNEFVDLVSKHFQTITHISFDHDLADEHYHGDMYKSEEDYYDSIKGTENTGYDCAKWMKDFYDEVGLKYPIMYVHSMNPVGTQKIINLFK